MLAWRQYYREPSPFLWKWWKCLMNRRSDLEAWSSTWKSSKSPLRHWIDNWKLWIMQLNWTFFSNCTSSWGCRMTHQYVNYKEKPKAEPIVSPRPGTNSVSNCAAATGSLNSCWPGCPCCLWTGAMHICRWCTFLKTKNFCLRPGVSRGLVFPLAQASFLFFCLVAVTLASFLEGNF